MARVHQNPKRPGHKTRLAAEAGDAALDFEECLLHRVFGVERIPQKIPCEVFHARALLREKSLVGAQVSGLAGGCQCEVLGPCRIRRRIQSGQRSGVTEFQTPLPVARYGRDSMLPGQCKSHCSHALLLRYRRLVGLERQAGKTAMWNGSVTPSPPGCFL